MRLKRDWVDPLLIGDPLANQCGQEPDKDGEFPLLPIGNVGACDGVKESSGLRPIWCIGTRLFDPGDFVELVDSVLRTLP